MGKVFLWDACITSNHAGGGGWGTGASAQVMAGSGIMIGQSLSSALFFFDGSSLKALLVLHLRDKLKNTFSLPILFNMLLFFVALQN